MRNIPSNPTDHNTRRVLIAGKRLARAFELLVCAGVEIDAALAAIDAESLPAEDASWPACRRRARRGGAA